MSSPKEIKDVFSKGDKFNLVWVPHLGDVGPLGLNFQILKKNRSKQTQLVAKSTNLGFGEQSPTKNDKI